MTAVPVGALSFIVLQSILEIAAVCLVGYLFAWRDVLTVSGRKELNQFNVNLFTPALLFSKIAFSLTPQLLASLWVVLVGFVGLTFLSGAFAWVMGLIFRLPRLHLGLCISGAMFMNSNTLPIALMQTLSTSLNQLNKDVNDTPENILARAVVILSLCSLLGSVFRWSFGVRLLDGGNHNLQAPDSLRDLEPPAAQPWDTKVVNVSETSILNDPEIGYQRENSRAVALEEIISPMTTSTMAPNPSYRDEVPQLTPSKPVATVCEPKGRHTSPRSDDYVRAQLAGNMKCRILNSPAVKGIREVFNPPLIASTLAIAVACIPPVQVQLGKVKLIRGILNMCASVAIPLTLIVLGALFYQSPTLKKTEKDAPMEKIQGSDQNFVMKTIILSIGVRQVVVPVVVMPLLLLLCLKSSITIIQDPVLLLTACLIISSPPAITLSQMTSKVNGSTLEELVSRLLLWSYTVVTPAVTIASAIVAFEIAGLKKSDAISRS